MNRFDVINQIVKAADKTYSYDVVRSARSIPKLDRIKIGSVSFNHATGGGVPRGRITQFFGECSSGKTTAACMVIAAAQRLCRHCWREPRDLHVEDVTDETGTNKRAIATCDCVKAGLWIPVQWPNEKDKEYKERLAGLQQNSFSEFICWFFDQEGTFDPGWAELHGVDLDRLLLSQPETAERTIDLVSSAIQSGSIDLVIIDSIAALTPSKEIESSSEDWQQGLQARLLNKAFRKWVAGTNEAYNNFHTAPTILCLQQIRQKIGMSYGDPTTRPGGKGQEFADSLDVRFWTSDKVVEEVQIGTAKDDKVKVPLEITVNFKVTKNKTGAPLRDGSFRMSLTNNPERGVRLGQILESDYIFSICMKLELIQQEGNKYYLAGEEFSSQKAIREWWRTHRFEYDLVRQMVENRLAELTA